MKKQAIFIYDSRTNKLVQVCDVRDLSSDQFESFSKQAKVNIAKILREQDNKEKALENTIDKLYDEHQHQLNNLRSLVKHLLGIETLSEEQINEMLYIFNEESQEDQSND